VRERERERESCVEFERFGRILWCLLLNFLWGLLLALIGERGFGVAL
jgi:hypothetical protein